jgi:hypothetical protein
MTDGVKSTKRVSNIVFTSYFAGQMKREEKSLRWKEERRE